MNTSVSDQGEQSVAECVAAEAAVAELGVHVTSMLIYSHIRLD